MIELFDLADVNKAPSAFSTDKLVWLNQHYIKAAEPGELAGLVKPFLDQAGIDSETGADLAAVVEAQRERAGTLVELADLCGFYYREFEDYVQGPAKKAFKGEADTMLEAVRERLSALSNWERRAIHEGVAATVADLDVGFGKVAMPLRVAVTGGSPSPDLDLTLALVGREATLQRIDRAISFIRDR
jgi:glutamyl-tRNA synthetase